MLQVMIHQPSGGARGQASNIGKFRARENSLKTKEAQWHNYY